MKKLPLTLLFVDSIPARIYLALLKKHNLYPAKLIFIAQCGNGRKSKLISRIFGDFITYRILKLRNKLSFKSNEDSNVGPLIENLLSNFNLSKKDILNCLEGYSGQLGHTIYCKNINDKFVREQLESERLKLFLFTGGGILSDDILNIPKSKFFHIHPGLVPDIRGADCFFWSYLIKGRLGYSVFYMNAGIDTGDILYRREYDISLTGFNYDSLTIKQIKNFILTYYDPCLRAMTFIDMLKDIASFKDLDSEKLSNLPGTMQNEEDGRTYFFMHDSLMREVIKMIIRDSKQ